MDVSWALRIASTYRVVAGMPYTASDCGEQRLDVYQPNSCVMPRPTLVFMHGGGWMAGSTKETWSLWFLPFLELGWVVVNVEYRPSNMSLAPAAAEDCVSALQWTVANAGSYSVDTRQIVLAGLSSGGHLALMAGMTADFVKPAAIVNWSGVTDVFDLIEGANRREFAAKWIGDRLDRLTIAKSMSPLTHVRAGIPPVITLHGDRDEIVPYQHAVRLHAALAEAGVAQQLVTLNGAAHASLDMSLSAYPRVFDFLARVGVTVQPS